MNAKGLEKLEPAVGKAWGSREAWADRNTAIFHSVESMLGTVWADCGSRGRLSQSALAAVTKNTTDSGAQTANVHFLQSGGWEV